MTPIYCSALIPVVYAISLHLLNNCNPKSTYPTLCPTLRLDTMSHVLDWVFRWVTIKRACSIWNRGIACALYGYSSDICNLPCATSRLFRKLDRVFADGLCKKEMTNRISACSLRTWVNSNFFLLHVMCHKVQWKTIRFHSGNQECQLRT